MYFGHYLLMLGWLLLLLSGVVKLSDENSWLPLPLTITAFLMAITAGVILWRTYPRGSMRQLSPGDGSDEAAWRRVEDERLQGRGRRGVD